MLDGLLAVWIIVEAARRKCRWVIPIGVLTLFYEAADLGWIRVSELISMEGTIKKLILVILAVFLFLAWRKKQLNLSAMVTGFLALMSRLAWSPVFDRYLDAIQKPEANYLALIAQGLTTKILFNVLTEIILFVMLALVLRGLLKMPLVQNESGC